MNEPTTPRDEGPPSPPAARRVHGLFWVGLIFAFLATHIVLMTVMMYIATSDPSVAVEPDYYQKGLNWNTTAEQLQRNRQLGWSIDVSVAKEGTLSGDRLLTCTLADCEDAAIEGAVVDVVAFAHARGNNRVFVPLRESGDGEYSGTLRFVPVGVWEFRFAVRKGDQVFTQTIEWNVYPSG